MGESAQAQAPGSPDSATDGHIVLRFPTLRRKARPPPEFMSIDEALDRLGVRDFPLEWGRSPAWREAPYNYESASKPFFKYALVKRDDGYRLSKRRFKSSLARDELKQCSRVYRAVRKALSAALTNDSVKASKLFFNGTIQDIPHEQRGLWSTQMRAIFYTGYARETTGDLRKFRILIERAAFDAWLASSTKLSSIDQTVSLDPSQIETTSRKTPPKPLLERIARALAARAQEAGYKPLRDSLGKLVRDALAEEMYKLSDRQFKISLWNSSELESFGQRGRRPEANRAMFEADGPYLRCLIKAEVARWRGSEQAAPATG